jgi:hypothetical protein
MTRQNSRPAKPKKEKAVKKINWYSGPIADKDRFGTAPLGPIPRSPEKQIVLLEHAVFELYEMLLRDNGWDNPSSISERLSSRTLRIAHRAYDRGYKELAEWVDSPDSEDWR